MVESCFARKFSYGINFESNFSCVFDNDVEGLKLSFYNKNFLQTKLLSSSNAYNVLAVYAAAKICEIADEKSIGGALERLEPVVGRFQKFNYRGIKIIVDYAHKPRAVEAILENIRSFCQKKLLPFLVVEAIGILRNVLS